MLHFREALPFLSGTADRLTGQFNEFQFTAIREADGVVCRVEFDTPKGPEERERRFSDEATALAWLRGWRNDLVYTLTGREVEDCFVSDNDIQIHNPFSSECGRFAVDPEATYGDAYRHWRDNPVPEARPVGDDPEP